MRMQVWNDVGMGHGINLYNEREGKNISYLIQSLWLRMKGIK